jgi:hypothetical protein
MRIKTPIVRDRPKSVHKHYCKYCPSKYFPSDPEADMIKELVMSGRIEKTEAIFPCAWRPEKICKGIAENLCYEE